MNYFVVMCKKLSNGWSVSRGGARPKRYPRYFPYTGDEAAAHVAGKYIADVLLSEGTATVVGVDRNYVGASEIFLVVAKTNSATIKGGW